ncbi:ferrochelatase [Legionella dresdenensis]|uniref:Ferrochelatase n=1 Tax=Legionella dresdenensis TaxID=450200 RepID=A0ABV8CFZ9_9GAMM
MKKGLLLINLGTPDNYSISAVRKYLAEFLADRRVIDLPAIVRYILLYGFILPFRPRQSAHAYQTIWQEQGSPLLIHSQKLKQELQQRLGDNYIVSIGMRYGNPSLADALGELADCETITILPLYPQYSSAATGSSIEKILTLIAQNPVQPSVQLIRDFYQHPGFIKALANSIKPYLANQDYLLLSYHGIPERHLHNAGCQSICAGSCPEPLVNPDCYRAQCYQTSRALAQVLGLSEQQYGVSFQSRLGKTPWIKPYTDLVFAQLAAQGVKRLAVACPSFVADCLETLEEIGIRGREQWLSAGGEELTLIPCLNESPDWVNALIQICGLAQPPVSNHSQ